MLKKFSKKLEQINNSIAVNSVNSMSTMWCVYLFTVLGMYPLLVPSSLTFVQYLSGAIIQLVSLPLIMVGQRAAGKTLEARALKDHLTIQKSFNEIKDMFIEIKAMHLELKEMQAESKLVRDENKEEIKNIKEILVSIKHFHRDLDDIKHTIKSFM